MQMNDRNRNTEQESPEKSSHRWSVCHPSQFGMLQDAPSNNEETSTLISSGKSDSGTTRMLPKSMPIWRMLSVNTAMSGVQYLFSIEFALVTPMLGTLGVSSAAAAIIWLAGPVSGLFVQPIVGVLSDNYPAWPGRRRLFIVFGAIFAVIGLLLLGFSAQIGYLTRIDSEKNHPVGILVAIIGLWILNIFLNVGQGPVRAIISDVVPEHQQQLGNAFCALFVGIGSLAAYGIGSVNFVALLPPKVLQIANLTNFEILMVIAVVYSLLSIIPTILFAGEVPLNKIRRNLRLRAVSSMRQNSLDRQSSAASTVVLPAESDDSNRGFSLSSSPKNPVSELIRVIRDMFVTTFTMPSYMRRVCLVFFFSWAAYSPFMVYITDWVGSTVYGGDAAAPVDSDPYNAYQEGVRFGTLALAGMSLVCVLFSSTLSIITRFTGVKPLYIAVELWTALLMFVPLFTSNKLVAVFVIGGMGLTLALFNTIPFTIVSQFVDQEKAGLYMGILNIFGVAGQLFANMCSAITLYFFPSKRAYALAFGGAFAIIDACVVPLLKMKSVEEEETED